MLNVTALLPIMKNMFQIVIVYFKTLKVFYKLIGFLFLVLTASDNLLYKLVDMCSRKDWTLQLPLYKIFFF